MRRAIKRKEAQVDSIIQETAPKAPRTKLIFFALGLCAGMVAGMFAISQNAQPVHAAAAIMPTALDVNGTNWAIEQVPIGQVPAEKADGATNCGMRHIWIAKGYNGSAERRLLMHELTHAMVCTGADNGFSAANMYYNSTTNDDHEGIYKFTILWSELLQRNPGLALYLGNQ